MIPSAEQSAEKNAGKSPMFLMTKGRTAVLPTPITPNAASLDLHMTLPVAHCVHEHVLPPDDGHDKVGLVVRLSGRRVELDNDVFCPERLHCALSWTHDEVRTARYCRSGTTRDCYRGC